MPEQDFINVLRLEGSVTEQHIDTIRSVLNNFPDKIGLGYHAQEILTDPDPFFDQLHKDMSSNLHVSRGNGHSKAYLDTSPRGFLIDIQLAAESIIIAGESAFDIISRYDKKTKAVIYWEALIAVARKLIDSDHYSFQDLTG